MAKRTFDDLVLEEAPEFVYYEDATTGASVPMDEIAATADGAVDASADASADTTSVATPVTAHPTAPMDVEVVDSTDVMSEPTAVEPEAPKAVEAPETTEVPEVPEIPETANESVEEVSSVLDAYMAELTPADQVRWHAFLVTQSAAAIDFICNRIEHSPPVDLSAPVHPRLLEVSSSGLPKPDVVQAWTTVEDILFHYLAELTVPERTVFVHHLNILPDWGQKKILRQIHHHLLERAIREHTSFAVPRPLKRHQPRATAAVAETPSTASVLVPSTPTAHTVSVPSTPSTPTVPSTPSARTVSVPSTPSTPSVHTVSVPSTPSAPSAHLVVPSTPSARSVRSVQSVHSVHSVRSVQPPQQPPQYVPPSPSTRSVRSVQASGQLIAQTPVAAQTPRTILATGGASAAHVPSTVPSTPQSVHSVHSVPSVHSVRSAPSVHSVQTASKVPFTPNSHASVAAKTLGVPASAQTPSSVSGAPDSNQLEALRRADHILRQYIAQLQGNDKLKAIDDFRRMNGTQRITAARRIHEQTNPIPAASYPENTTIPPTPQAAGSRSPVSQAARSVLSKASKVSTMSTTSRQSTTSTVNFDVDEVKQWDKFAIYAQFQRHLTPEQRSALGARLKSADTEAETALVEHMRQELLKVAKPAQVKADADQLATWDDQAVMREYIRRLPKEQQHGIAQQVASASDDEWNDYVAHARRELGRFLTK